MNRRELFGKVAVGVGAAVAAPAILKAASSRPPDRFRPDGIAYGIGMLKELLDIGERYLVWHHKKYHGTVPAHFAIETSGLWQQTITEVLRERQRRPPVRLHVDGDGKWLFDVMNSGGQKKQGHHMLYLTT